MIELSVILPTYNECANLSILVEKLQALLENYSYEVIIVDDNSEDGTWEFAKTLSFQHQNIHLIRRIDRKGLTSAILEGLIVGKRGAFSRDGCRYAT